MSKTSRQKAALKGKKKRWFRLEAPAIFNNVEIGETLAYDVEELMEKTTTIDLRSLTGSVKHQNINIKLKVAALKENTGKTEVVAFEVLPTTIKRVIRRRSEKIESSFIVTTKDNRKLRIKPLILTRFNTNNSIKAAILKASTEFIAKEVGETSYTDLVTNVINNKLPTSLKEHLKKISPIKRVVIRRFTLLELEPASKPKQAPKRQKKKAKSEQQDEQATGEAGEVKYVEAESEEPRAAEQPKKKAEPKKQKAEEKAEKSAKPESSPKQNLPKQKPKVNNEKE
ncbi:hypothetical protein KY320_03500 [Candidatus Woesearchaeota archaeon]|nr:hypothetical protein [Candidatus Woesearchaeota archaeon]